MRTSDALWRGTVLTLAIVVIAAQNCRDCSLNACLAVAKTDGSCDGCICNGLLLPDCDPLNCTSATCVQQMNPEGCQECTCFEEVQEVCPPIPPCPSRCQIQLTTGCPRCTCPEEATERACPAVNCPSSCWEVTGVDGCPSCECPPPDIVCPKMPACPLGCIDEHEDLGYESCLDCNCTIIEDLLSVNQIIPTDDVEYPFDFATEVELVPELIDDGLILAEDQYDEPIMYDTFTEDFPPATTILNILPDDYVDTTTLLTANIPPNAGRQPSMDSLPMVPSSTSPEMFFPTDQPTLITDPTNSPTPMNNPTNPVTNNPTTMNNPTNPATNNPTTMNNPTNPATNNPTTMNNPTNPATNNPTTMNNPTNPATNNPTTMNNPTNPATNNPTTMINPTNPATNNPTTMINPTNPATNNPTTMNDPTNPATNNPTTMNNPTNPATNNPTTMNNPTNPATNNPTTMNNPTNPATNNPTTMNNPTNPATNNPTTMNNPTNPATNNPTTMNNPTNPATNNPTTMNDPTNPATNNPTTMNNPTNQQTDVPTPRHPQNNNPTPSRGPQNTPQPPPVNIPCGETSCPQGCSLCIQRDGCGRCLCGSDAIICPAVPACKVSCITAAENGCVQCSCQDAMSGAGPNNISPFNGPSRENGRPFPSNELPSITNTLNNQPGFPYRGNPEQPFMNPEQPFMNPEQPFMNPEQPFMNPEQPFMNPEQPFMNPEQPFMNPEQPFMNPEQPFRNRMPGSSIIPSLIAAAGGLDFNSAEHFSGPIPGLTDIIESALGSPLKHVMAPNSNRPPYQGENNNFQPQDPKDFGSNPEPPFVFSPGFMAISRIPPNLLGVSRLHNTGK